MVRWFSSIFITSPEKMPHSEPPHMLHHGGSRHVHMHIFRRAWHVIGVVDGPHDLASDCGWAIQTQHFYLGFSKNSGDMIPINDHLNKAKWKTMTNQQVVLKYNVGIWGGQCEHHEISRTIVKQIRLEFQICCQITYQRTGNAYYTLCNST